MSLAVVVLVGAIVVGLAAGGSWRRLTDLPLRRLRLVVAAVLAQVGGTVVGALGIAQESTSYAVGLALSAAFALAFCWHNGRTAGVPLVTAGLILNALVVAANGAMPVSIVAAYHARVPIAAISAGTDARHEIAGEGTALSWLGDVVPLPLPLRPEVVSAGDVLVVAGLAELVVVGMLPAGAVMRWRRRKEHSHGEEGTQASRPQEEQGQPRPSS
ncbi:MAG: DUF5317 domain-containing protein [Frankiaceae bacterium]|nr:DUF5317 domain-containing protein [Frankiaceae bacterium]